MNQIRLGRVIVHHYHKRRKQQAKHAVAGELFLALLPGKNFKPYSIAPVLLLSIEPPAYVLQTSDW